MKMRFQEYIILREELEEKAKENSVIDKIKEFFKTNQAPTDDEIHGLAIKLDLDTHDLETKIYGLLGQLLAAQEEQSVEKVEENTEEDEDMEGNGEEEEEEKVEESADESEEEDEEDEEEVEENKIVKMTRKTAVYDD